MNLFTFLFKSKNVIYVDFVKRKKIVALNFILW